MTTFHFKVTLIRNRCFARSPLFVSAAIKKNKVLAVDRTRSNLETSFIMTSHSEIIMFVGNKTPLVKVRYQTA